MSSSRCCLYMAIKVQYKAKSNALTMSTSTSVASHPVIYRPKFRVVGAHDDRSDDPFLWYQDPCDVTSESYMFQRVLMSLGILPPSMRGRTCPSQLIEYSSCIHSVSMARGTAACADKQGQPPGYLNDAYVEIIIHH